ncbi:MAG: NUDIX domain-containing protein [Planctomycetota bacterium]
MTSDNPVVGILGIMRRGDRMLVIQRARRVKAPLTWCFPGGHIEDGESQPEALVREMREELGIRVEPGEFLMTQTKHGGRLVLHCWSATIIDGEPVANPQEVADVVWLTSDEIRRHNDVLPGMTHILDTIGL